MIERPKRKSLTIVASTNERDVIVEPLTVGALMFVREHAPQFGRLIENEKVKHQILTVYFGYNRDEVVAYLSALWEELHGGGR